MNETEINYSLKRNSTALKNHNGLSQDNDGYNSDAIICLNKNYHSDNESSSPKRLQLLPNLIQGKNLESRQTIKRFKTFHYSSEKRFKRHDVIFKLRDNSNSILKNSINDPSDILKKFHNSSHVIEQEKFMKNNKSVHLHKKSQAFRDFSKVVMLDFKKKLAEDMNNQNNPEKFFSNKFKSILSVHFKEEISSQIEKTIDIMKIFLNKFKIENSKFEEFVLNEES